MAIAQFGREILGKGRKRIEIVEVLAPVTSGEIAPELPPSEVHRREAKIWVWIIGFLIAIWLLGFSLAVAVTTLLYLKIAGHEKWPITIILTVGGWAFFYGVFNYGLHIPFPDAQLFLWFPSLNQIFFWMK